jgi:hypothetical protein
MPSEVRMLRACLQRQSESIADVHQRLVSLGRGSGRQLMDVERDATSALERARYAQTVSAEIDALRQDPAAWNADLADADLAVGDG